MGTLFRPRGSQPETDSVAGRLSFAKVLQHKLQSDGHSVAWLASTINVPRPTVQTWLSRGRFPAGQLDHILSAAGIELTRQELEREYDVEFTKWTKSRSPRARAGGAEPGDGAPAGAPGPNDRYLSLLQSLADGDLLVSVISDGLPPEVGEALVTMAAPVRHRALVEALENGASVRYLVPDAAQRKRWAEWDPQLGTGPIERIEETLRWWTAQAGLTTAAAARVSVIAISDAPIFTAGQHVVARLTRRGEDWEIAEGWIFADTGDAGRRRVTIPPSLARVIVALVAARAATPPSGP